MATMEIEATTYVFIRKDNYGLLALKMEKDKPGPHFVRVLLATQVHHGNGYFAATDYTEGDTITVSELRPISASVPVSMLLGEPEWPERGSPRPQATVARAFFLENVVRCTELVVVMSTCNRIVTFIDPHSMTEKQVERRMDDKEAYFKYSLAEVQFATRQQHSFVHQHRHYVLPADCPYDLPPLVQPQRFDDHLPLSIRAISSEEQQHLMEFYRSPQLDIIRDANLIDRVLYAGAAIMQSETNRELKLSKPEVKVQLRDVTVDDAIITGTYDCSFMRSVAPAPSKKPRVEAEDTRLVAERCRAGRVFKSDQMVLVQPKNATLKRFALATVVRSVVEAEAVHFTIRVPNSHAENVWVDEWTELVKDKWTIKAVPAAITSRDFRDLLHVGELAEVLGDFNESPVTMISRAIFGDTVTIAEPGPIELPPRENSEWKTDEQRKAIALAASENHPVSILKAGAGSGKTTTTAAMVEELLEKQPGAIAITATMNIAVDGLATKLAQQLTAKKVPMLVMQSASYLAKKSASDPYQEYRLPYKLYELATGGIADLNDDEQQIAEAAARVACKKFSRLDGISWNTIGAPMEDEGLEHYHKGIQLLVKYYRPRIFLGTIASLSPVAKLFSPLVSVLLIEEAGTVSTLEAAQFLVVWKCLKNLVLIGDAKQLPNYTAQLPERLKGLGFISVLKQALSNKRIPRTLLTKVFRSHPKLVEIISLFAYKGKLSTDVKPQERAMMKRSGLPFPEDYPILVVDCKGEHDRTLLRSYRNAEQSRIAKELGCVVHENLPQADVRYLTLYGGARDELLENLSHEQLKFQTTAVDAAQGQETDLTILETALVPEEDTRTDFAGLKERINVAISRARHGLIILANVRAMSAIPTWNELFAIIRDRCPAAFMTPEQVLRARDTPVTQASLALQAMAVTAPIMQVHITTEEHDTVNNQGASIRWPSTLELSEPESTDTEAEEEESTSKGPQTRSATTGKGSTTRVRRTFRPTKKVVID